jgi:hypothetical protein
MNKLSSQVVAVSRQSDLSSITEVKAQKASQEVKIGLIPQ